jgi:hypothetical protein
MQPSEQCTHNDNGGGSWPNYRGVQMVICWKHIPYTLLITIYEYRVRLAHAATHISIRGGGIIATIQFPPPSYTSILEH